jgi:7-carboxy-7-deazaguanine synthase
MEEQHLTVKVNEIFYSIQGESTYAGLPCVFVRLTYCNLRCTYCDTSYAFYEGDDLTIEEILARVEAFRCNLVEVTGGEPLVQKNSLPLLRALCDAGYEVLLETGGHMDIAPVDKRVKRIMDIKCPSSGESAKVRWQNVDFLTPEDQVKFVIGDRADFEFARDTVRKYILHAKCPVLFSPVFGRLENKTLAEWILQEHLPVRLQLQMHKYIWPPDQRGV